MELKGKLLDIVRDIRSGDFRLTLAVKEIPSGVDRLPEGDLSISLKRWREKRTLTANAYYWVLVGKIAQVLGTPQIYVHNLLLREYGQLEMVGGQLVTVMLPDTDEAENKVLMADLYHMRPTSFVKSGKNGQMFRAYYMLKGSSQYDSQEFSLLLEGAINEARDLNIEILPAEEIERMMSAYEGRVATG
jgi:hypothetical protein